GGGVRRAGRRGGVLGHPPPPPRRRFPQTPERGRGPPTAFRPPTPPPHPPPPLPHACLRERGMPAAAPMRPCAAGEDQSEGAAPSFGGSPCRDVACGGPAVNRPLTGKFYAGVKSPLAQSISASRSRLGDRQPHPPDRPLSGCG